MEIIHNQEDLIDDDIEESGEELAIGLKIPSSIKVPTGHLDSLRRYKDIYNDIHKQIEVCNKLYKYNGIVGNAVDVLIDFAVTNVRPLPTGDARLDKILKNWFGDVNTENSNTLPGMYPLMQEMCLEWFTSGNVFPYAKWSNIKIDKTFYKIPNSINLINPESIEIPTGPIAFGQEVIYLKYDAELLDKLRKDGRSDPEAALVKQAVPRSILNAINKGETFSKGIRLNPRYITHLKRRAKGYQAWGVPYLTRCFGAASLLERLRELDESITSGLLNLVTIFKIGTDERPASGARLRRFAGLLRNPKATTTLVWAHDIEMIQVGPDGKVLQFKAKYQDAKEDLLTSLGIPPVLMSLKQSGDEWVSILALIERLSNWRKTMSLWLEKTCNQIAEFNGINKKVKVKWDRMNLTDESSVKNLIIAFYDRGLISIDTALKESGYDLEAETKAKKKEKPIEELFTPPNLPFSGNSDAIKGRPNEQDPKRSLKTKKKDNTKSENTVNLKEQVKKSKPKVK